MEIRDTRNGSWYWVNTAVNACPHITHADKSVYGALAGFAGFQEIRPTVETIAEKSNTSTRQANRSIVTLSKVGLITIIAGGGRGRANVYQLNKCPKGCQICSVSKPCQNKQETLTKKTVNSDNLSGHIDIYIDKEIDTAPQSDARVPIVIDLFKEVNPSYQRLFRMPPQRAAVSRLLETHGQEKLSSMISYLPKSNASRYAPTITTPVQFEQKLGELIAWSQKQKQEKGRGIVGFNE